MGAFSNITPGVDTGSTSALKINNIGNDTMRAIREVSEFANIETDIAYFETGTIVYAITEDKYYQYSGSAWIEVSLPTFTTITGAITDGASVDFTTSLTPSISAEVTGFVAASDGSVFYKNATSDPAWSGTKLSINSANGYVGLGTATPSSVLNLVDEGSNNVEIMADRYGTGNPGLVLRRARGTILSPTAVQANDVMGTIAARGYDGTTFPTSSRVFLGMYASENWSTTAQGTYMTFWTTQTGGIIRSEKMRIGNNGYIGIGTTTPDSIFNVSTEGDMIAMLDNYSAITNSNLMMRRARGTAASPTAVQLDDALGTFTARGYATTGFSSNSVGIIGIYAAENFTDTANGTYLKLSTTNNGTTVATAKMVITNDGRVGIGTSTPDDYALLDLTSLTGSLILPRMSTAQRDAMTPVSGMIIFNATLATFQIYYQSGWKSINTWGSITGTLSNQTDLVDEFAKYPLLAPATTARNVIQPSANIIPLTLKGNASQTNNLLDFRNSSNTLVASVNYLGDVSARSVYFNSAGVTPLTIGQMGWDTDRRTLQVRVSDEVTLQVGQENLIWVKNDDTVDFTSGDVVYVSGGLGTNVLAKLATAADAEKAPRTVGIVTENIAQSNSGFVCTQGIVHGMNTLAWDEGTRLFVSTTPGDMVATPPAKPNTVVVCGIVIRQHATEGEMYVRIRLYNSLGDLNTVSITDPVTGNLLQYNGSTTLWENTSTPSTGSLTLANGLIVNNSGGTTGDTQIKTDTESNAIFVDASADTVNIAGTTNGVRFDKGHGLTYIGSAVEYNDLTPIPLLTQRVGASNNPTLSSMIGNIYQLTFAVGDYVFGAYELTHEYVEGADIYPHVHWATNGTDTSDRYAKYEIEYSISNHKESAPFDALFPATQLATGETLIPANTGSLAHILTPLTTISGSGLKIGSYILYRFRRIAASSTAPTSNPFCINLGFHITVNTLGSRAIGTK